MRSQELYDSKTVDHSPMEFDNSKKAQTAGCACYCTTGRSTTNATKSTVTKEAPTEFPGSDVSSETVDRQKLPRKKKKKKTEEKETGEGEELMSPDSERETGDKESWGYLSFRWSTLRRQSLFLIPEWTGVDRLILRAAGR